MVSKVDNWGEYWIWLEMVGEQQGKRIANSNGMKVLLQIGVGKSI